MAAAAARWIDSELWVQLAGSATQVFERAGSRARQRAVDSRGIFGRRHHDRTGLNFAVRLFKTVPSRPAFVACLARRTARPAFQRAETIGAG
ncbi:hypothetical protein ACVWWK_001783 [Bradyrhizobium sp. LB9.1b]